MDFNFVKCGSVWHLGVICIYLYQKQLQASEKPGKPAVSVLVSPWDRGSEREKRADV